MYDDVYSVSQVNKLIKALVEGVTAFRQYPGTR